MTGILPIDKHKGITSFGIVAKMRGITGERKAGHAGTLDPMATGVLPVLFGGATRFLDYLPDHRKGYQATFCLGFTTDTLDITGRVLTTSRVQAAYEDVERLLPDFRGEIQQIPPMFSAISKDGVRLYDLARQGVTVERESRRVFIEQLDIIAFDQTTGEYTIDVVCSKGTYIRSLIDDIGCALGCGAVMTGLRRTFAAGFPLSQCMTVEQVQAVKDAGGDFTPYLITVEQAFESYAAVTVTAPQANRFANGGALDLVRVKPLLAEGFYRVYSPDGLFLGLGQVDLTAGQLKVLRLLTIRD